MPPWGLKNEVITTHVAQGQGLGGQGGFCSHCILWRMVWALLVSPGLSKVRVSEECVGGRPGGPLPQGLLRKVPFASSPGRHGWKGPSPGVLPEAAWLRTRCCPVCPGVATTRWVTHAQAQGILSPSPIRGGSGGNAIPSSLASLETEFSSMPLSPPRMGQQGFSSVPD